MFDRRVSPPHPSSGARRVAQALVAVLTATGLGVGALAARANPGDPPGTIRTVAGMTRNYSQGGFGGDGGKATDAQLYNPRAVAFGRSGDVYPLTDTYRA